MSMNLWIVQGNLTKDPEQIETKGDTCMASFTLAVNSKFKNKETGERDADFHKFKCFGKTAEYVLTWLRKGHNATVTATVKNANYEKDGQKVWNDDYIANEVQGNGKRAKDEEK